MIDQFKTMPELNAAVEANGDVATVMMWQVRDAYGQERLGTQVRTGIEKALAKLGLGHYPVAIPTYQDEPVRIYKKGTEAADLIEAVLSVDEDTDAVIRDAVGGDAAATLEKVKELVCP
jgi:hypothetical protein